MNAADVLRRAYAAYAARDLDTALAPFAENARYVHYPPGSGAPFSGEFIGINAIRERIINLAETFEYQGFEALSVICEGDIAAARVRVTVKNRMTERTLEIELAHFVYFEDGKVVEFHEYGDSAMISDVARMTVD